MIDGIHKDLYVCIYSLQIMSYVEYLMKNLARKTLMEWDHIMSEYPKQL